MRALFAFVAFLIAGPALAGDMMVMDPYARTSRPGAPTGAVFMVLHNMSEADDRLLGVRTDAAKRAELHTHIDDNGVVKMRKVEEGIAIPAGQVRELTRGADHVMLLGVTQDLIDGETIPLTLMFEVAGEITLNVPVDSARGQAGAHKH